jgi:hypothetical protein
MLLINSRAPLACSETSVIFPNSFFQASCNVLALIERPESLSM